MKKVYSAILGLLLGVTSSNFCAQEPTSFIEQCQDAAKTTVSIYAGFYAGIYSVCLGVASYMGVKAPSCFNREESCKSDIRRRVHHTFTSVAKEVLSEMLPPVHRSVLFTLPLFPVVTVAIVGYKQCKKKI